ncbi:MAG: ATP-binding protein, partial [Treponema sp.]|nr:ATP-binding protein [Treponema sp.]
MVTETNDHDSSKFDFIGHVFQINDIIRQAGGINDLFYEFAMPHMVAIGTILHISPAAAVILASLVELYNGRVIQMFELAKNLKMKYVNLIQYMDDIYSLEQKDLIYIHHSNDDFDSLSEEVHTIELRYSALEAIYNGNYDDLSSTKNLSINDFFIQLEQLCTNRLRRKLSWKNTITKMRNLLADNSHLIFVRCVVSRELPDAAMLILLFFFYCDVMLEKTEMTFNDLERIYDHSSEFAEIKRQFTNRSYILFNLGLIENVCVDGFGSAESFCLTDKTLDEFLVEMDTSHIDTPMKEIKTPDSITDKKLFYPEKTRQSIDELISILQPENFSRVRNQLTENGMRLGFACLFSGGPGTGKTETAYQIARNCGRGIMHIDIANTKCMYFGESEKKIKGIFDKYRSFVNKSQTMPILFFNEADAVFGKRQILDESQNALGQTENAIQNVILQEMENLNGILIATTNLTVNMDAAFERRFLYKIEFEKPEAAVRKEIWKSMMPYLNDEDAITLSGRFDFSGGQIEN